MRLSSSPFTMHVPNKADGALIILLQVDSGASDAGEESSALLSTPFDDGSCDVNMNVPFWGVTMRPCGGLIFKCDDSLVPCSAFIAARTSAR